MFVLKKGVSAKKTLLVDRVHVRMNLPVFAIKTMSVCARKVKSVKKSTVQVINVCVKIVFVTLTVIVLQVNNAFYKTI